MSEATGGDAIFSPTMHSRNRRISLLGDGARAAESVNDFGCDAVFHDIDNAIIVTSRQQQSYDIRDCGNRRGVVHGRMEDVAGNVPEEVADVFRRMRAIGLKQADLAVHLGLEKNKVSLTKTGKRQMTVPEYVAAIKWLEEREAPRDDRPSEAPQTPINDEALTAVLAAVLKYAPRMEGSDSLAQNVAQALTELLRLVGSDPAILANPGVLEGAARLAVSRFPEERPTA
jgi:hypothetical protein